MVSNDKAFARRLLAICDLIIVTSVVTSVCCWFSMRLSLAWSISIVNVVASAGLHIWVAKILNTAWNDSWLNLSLKRCLDLTVALALAVFVLPVCILSAFIIIKVVRRGPIFSVSRFRFGAEEAPDSRVIRGLVLRRSDTIMDTMLIRRMPMVTNVLLWQISITDILTMTELAKSERHEPLENDTSYDDNDTEDNTINSN